MNSIKTVRPITTLGLKDAFKDNKSIYSTQGQGGFYKDLLPGTIAPRAGMYAYVHPENGTSAGGIHPPVV